MDRLYTNPFTLSSKGRVSFSPEVMPLHLQCIALDTLSICLPGCSLTDEKLLDFLQTISQCFTPGMSETMFRLASKAAIFAWAQHYLAITLQQDESPRQYIRETLCRCIPALLVTDDLVTRCERAPAAPVERLWDCDGAIFSFVAREMLAEPEGRHPLWQRLHHSAELLNLSAEDASRDDLRLVVLHALYDPDVLPRTSETAFLPLRLGLKGAAPLSIETLAAKTQLPVLYIREVEEAALQALIHAYATEDSHA